MLSALLLAQAGIMMPIPVDGVIERSGKVAPGKYFVSNYSVDGTSSALTIKGNNLVLDFSGVELLGSSLNTMPDDRKGFGVRVIGSNITIRNLRVRGYKVGVFADGCKNLTIENSDFSDNWKQHLRSTLEKEDLGDWMSFHHNEQDEWFEYGAGIYLKNCDAATIRHNTILRGQCGLMITRCNNSKIYRNNFSFLSGLGIGMYRSSQNQIMLNNIDWCVRGYSHGVYNRGQDSAGILVYEQSNDNIFAYNSVTHGGDGFFLWAGQTTMDTGKGGCNDNLVYGNDFSHAPTNGIEATFSRNIFENNLLMECWHGVWGGYSYDSKVNNNIFAYNAESISIEHGQNISITGNYFFREANAIHLWMKEKEDPSWGYPKYRDTRSTQYEIRKNTFDQITQGNTGTGLIQNSARCLNVVATSKIRFEDNLIGNVGGILQLKGPLTDFYAEKIRPIDGSRESITTIDLPSLGSGWEPQHQGEYFLGSDLTNLMPPVMRTSGNVILPYPEGPDRYPNRFKHNWNPMPGAPSGPIKLGDFASGLGGTFVPVSEQNSAKPQPLDDGGFPALDHRAKRGRANILVDEWGPYDFQRPILWPRETVRKPNGATAVRFEVLGPKGSWQISKIAGAKLNRNSGKCPGFLEAEFPANVTETDIRLKYIGEETTDFLGNITPAGQEVEFGYDRFQVPQKWSVKFWNYSLENQDPRKIGDDFSGKFGAPAATLSDLSDLLFNWYGSPAEKVQGDYFATQAETEINVPKGNYDLEVTADDGVRMYLDGKLVLDEWKYSAPQTYTIRQALEGKHQIVLKHFELNGFACLQFRIKKSP